MDLDECLEYAVLSQNRFDWKRAASGPDGEPFVAARKFIEDPWRMKASFTTRRGAKSYTDGIHLFKDADETPNSNCLYLGLTRLSAKGIIWKDVLKDIDARHNLGTTFHETELTATLPNGSMIYVAGVDIDENERKKLFGRKYKTVVIDEAALYGIDLRDLVYVVLRPALADMRGTLILSGMASDITRGLFYDITVKKEQGWSLHEWSAHDNPYMSVQWKEELEFIKTNQPALMQTARFRQAYLNEWVVDQDKLVYRFNPAKNIFKELPYPHSKGWTYMLGVDTGWEDDNAFVLSAYHENDPKLYILKAWKKKHMYFDHDDPSLSVLKTIERFCKDDKYPASRVIIDGANKQGVETMKMRSGIHFEYADKAGKADHIEMMNGDFLLGNILVHESCTEYIDELTALIWRTEGSYVVIPRKEDPRLPNHLCDAGLYNWYNGYHFLGRAAKKAPLPGTPEYIKEQEDLHKQAIMDKIKREQAQKFGEPYNFGMFKDKMGRDPWNNWD